LEEIKVDKPICRWFNLAEESSVYSAEK